VIEENKHTKMPAHNGRFAASGGVARPKDSANLQVSNHKCSKPFKVTENEYLCIQL